MEKKRRYGTAKTLKKEFKKRAPVIRKSNVCCISSCSNSCKQFYLFPSDPERFKEWNDIINKYRADIGHIKNKLICRIHFEEKYLTKNNSLSKKAIPTLYLADEGEEDEQSELSDYNDVIESFNSSYPCFDDSYIMEANVEICETGEALELKNDHQVS